MHLGFLNLLACTPAAPSSDFGAPVCRYPVEMPLPQYRVSASGAKYIAINSNKGRGIAGLPSHLWQQHHLPAPKWDGGTDPEPASMSVGGGPPIVT